MGQKKKKLTYSYVNGAVSLCFIGLNTKMVNSLLAFINVFPPIS